MIHNYLKIALRNLKRHKAYTAINVAGLAVGMACCLLLLLYVQHELAFDRFHDNADRIVRLGRLAAYPEEVKRFANTGAAAAPTLKAEFPAVEEMVRIMPSYPQDLLVSHGDQRFYETTFFWADSTVFDVFSFSLKRGDPGTALTQPFTVVLTEAMAHKYFGDEDPMGKTLTAHHWTTHDYTVTGILEEVPATSHLQFDFLASMVGEEPLYSFLFEGEGQWSNSLSFAYLLLSDADAAATIEPQLAAFAERHMGAYAAGRGFVPGFLLQPLTDIHLHSDLSNEIGVTSDIRYVYLFSAIAFLILVIACINFMNLATARAAERAKEVGMRKVLGAHRGQLIRQFFSESVLLTLIALLFAIVLLHTLLPVFNQISGLALSLTATSARWLGLGLLGVSVFVGVVAGGYPALYLSGFRPVGVLKGTFKTSRSGVALRKGLVVFQFAVSMVLIAGTFVILSQLDYLHSKPLGFEKEQIVVLPLRADVLREHYETIKQDLAQHPGVVRLSAAAGTPGNRGLIDRFPIRPTSAPETEQRPMHLIGTDYDYLDVLGLHLVAGRAFSKAYPTDAAEAFIINETAAHDLGWDNPVGKEIYLNVDEGKRGTIIGVVQDFHFQSLHLPIEPAVLTLWPGRFTALNVKIRPDDIAGTLRFLEDRWPTYAPDQPFQYSFLDEDFNRQYQAEVRLSSIFSVFSSLAILIACLGLFGLAAFTTQQRTKEIGVRKVLGASVAGIVALLSKDFLKLVLVAFVLATPVVYLAANRWLDGFAYRVEISGWIFLMAGSLALAIAFLTVSYQALKAATMTPVKSLRSE